MFSQGNSSSPWRLPRYVEWALGIAVVLQLVAPFFAQASGTDGPNSLYWIDQFWGQLHRGVAFPKWLPNGFDGLGSPTFYFYPPLAFYLASGVRWVSGSITANTTFQIAALIATIASFFSARLLIRNVGASKYWAAIGAALYAFAPFRVAELYSRSSLSTHVSLVFLPLVWLGIVWIFRRKDVGNGVAMLAVSAAALMVSSIPVFIASALMIVVVGAWFWNRLGLRQFIGLGLAAVLAVGMAAFYIVPAVRFAEYVKASSFFREPDFFIVELLHFRSVVELYHTALIFASIAGCILIWRKARNSSGALGIAARVGFGISVVIVILQVPLLSMPLWHNVPPLKMLQGSWRLFSNVVLITAVVVGVSEGFENHRVISALVLALSVGAIVPTLPALTNVHLFQHYQPTASDPPEYLPRFADGLVPPGPVGSVIRAQPPLAATESLTATPSSDTSTQLLANFRESHSVTIKKHYWPLVQYSIVGRTVLSSTDQHGMAVLNLPAGQFEVQSAFEQSDLERISLVISEATVMIVLLGCISLLSLSFRRRATVNAGAPEYQSQYS